ncbi:MAG: UbiA family prenyltransferase, partial [Phycisphaerae bacterium]|nr:UbiA family prenyltransferase [Phycisphaerae bacterium]
YLALPILIILCVYPLMKRWTWFRHFYLGTCLAVAPICAWIAIGGQWHIAPVLMAAAVLLWTAGFDVIYACQDYDSDRALGVHSLPARLGLRRALLVARVTHGLCVVALILLGLFTAEFAGLYFAAVAIVAGLLLVEHWLVRPDDLSRVNLAFFTVNGIISLLIGLAGMIDIHV